MKQRTKKLTSILLIGCMVLVMSGCSKSKVPDSYNYDLTKYITLGQYEGLEYTKTDTSVTDQEIDEYIQEELEFNAESEEITEGVVAEGDTLNINYKGSVDGKELDSMAADDAEITISKDSGFIPGFAEALVGHKIGETFDINVTFPDPYTNNTELSGKAAVFKITVNHKIVEKVPELNDDYVKEYYEEEGLSTVAELKEYVKGELTTEKEDSALESETSAIFQQIVDGSEFPELPEEELTKKKEEMVQNYKDLAEQYGMEYADLLEQMMGLTEEEFNTEVDTASENAVKQELTLHALAKALNVKISNKQYSDYLDELLEEAELDRESFEEMYGQTIDEYAEDYDIYQSYLYDTVMEKVMELSVVKEG